MTFVCRIPKKLVSKKPKQPLALRRSHRVGYQGESSNTSDSSKELGGHSKTIEEDDDEEEEEEHENASVELSSSANEEEEVRVTEKVKKRKRVIKKKTEEEDQANGKANMRADHVVANGDQDRVTEGEQNVGLQSQSHEHLTPNNIKPSAGDSSFKASAPTADRVADNDSVEVVPPDEQRCHKSNGRGWRCKKRKRCHEPSSFCDQHYNIHARENKKRRKLEATHYPSFESHKKSRMQQNDFERDLNSGLSSAAIPFTIDPSQLNSFREEGSALSETHSGHQLVGGLSVPRHFVPLYTKIWEKYGHIATTKEMSDKTLNMVTGKMLEDWENQILTCEHLQFNVAWLRQRLDSIKEDRLAGNVLPSLDAIKKEEDALIQEREKIRKMAQDLKVRIDAFSRIAEMVVDKWGKPLLDGLF